MEPAQEKTHTKREEGHVKTEAGIVIQLPAKECQKLPTNARGQERAMKDSSLEALEGAWPRNTLISDFQPPEL